MEYHIDIYHRFNYVTSPSTENVNVYSILFAVTDVYLGFFETAANILLTANGDVKVSPHWY